MGYQRPVTGPELNKRRIEKKPPDTQRGEQKEFCNSSVILSDALGIYACSSTTRTDVQIEPG